MEEEKETKLNIPTIRTFDGDILNAVKSQHLDEKSILSQELDKTDIIQAAVANQQTKRKLTSLMLILLIIISLTTLAGVYYYYSNSRIKSLAIEEDLQSKRSQIRIYKLEEIWADVPDQIKNNVSAATSTDSSVLVKISNFDELYPFLLNNEASLITLAINKFGYVSLDTFSDFPVENNDLRIADAGTGPLVYGFIDKDFLIISNSIREWLKAKQSIAQ